MKNPMITILGVVVIFFIVLFSVQYGVLAIGSTEDGVNMAGNTHEAQYKAAQNTSITGVAFVQDSPMFLGFLILVIALLGFGYYIKV